MSLRRSARGRGDPPTSADAGQDNGNNLTVDDADHEDRGGTNARTGTARGVISGYLTETDLPDGLDDEEAEVDASMVLQSVKADEDEDENEDGNESVGHGNPMPHAGTGLQVGENDATARPARPSRKAAQEATKRISMGNAKLAQDAESEYEREDEGDIGDDDGDDMEVDDDSQIKGKGKGKARSTAPVKMSNESVTSTSRGKRGKGKGKGKGIAKVKANANAIKRDPDDEDEPESDAGSEFEDPTPSKNKIGNVKPDAKKKKVILAKAVYWDDIPKWKEGEGSHLMEMPLEIMDEIFGLRVELGMREYVALAGTCTFFRHYLNDEFFEAAYKGSTLQGIRDIDTIEASGHLHSATRPFTRDIKDWRIEPPRTFKDPRQTEAARLKAELEAKKKVSHYVPRGDRSTWTKAQYTVYKEEKARAHRIGWQKRKTELRTMAKEILEFKANIGSWVINGRRSRYVLAVIDGREDGQPPVQKDERGLPIPEQAVKAHGDDDQASHLDGNPATDYELKPLNAGKVCTGEADNQAAEKLDDDSQGNQNKRKSSGKERGEISDTGAAGKSVKPEAKKAKTRKSSKPWAVPDTSDDEGEGHDEIAFMRGQGLSIVHDYWPSSWRAACAARVDMMRISKTSALSVYKVTESELLTLRHVLTHNSMNSKQPTQLFFEAAVQALAYRAHGGVDKHKAYLQQSRMKAVARLDMKDKREEQARRDGTWTHKKKKRNRPHWQFCCAPDPDLCYCDECWCGRCDCYCGRHPGFGYLECDQHVHW